jgi:uncharacterized protein (DUF1501 family)
LKQWGWWVSKDPESASRRLDWPGLSDHQLYQGRDLALTTDFRDVLGELVLSHLGNRNLSEIFPAYAPRKFRSLI